MMLLYVLFALTVAMVLTALFGKRMRERKSGEVFIGMFVLLFLAAWTAGELLAPAVSAGTAADWLPYLLVGLFALILAVSAFLSVRSRGGPLTWAGVRGDNRREAEVLAFDIILWLMVLVFGITVLRSFVL